MYSCLKELSKALSFITELTLLLVIILNLDLIKIYKFEYA